MTGSEYEEQYDTTVDGSQAAMGLLGIVPIIAGVLAVLLAVMMFKTAMWG